MKTITIKKGHLLQYEGDFNSSVYKVESGLLRSYTIDDKGKEHIFMFAPEGWIVADSTKPDMPSPFFIDALEDSILLITDKNYTDFTPSIDQLANRLAVLEERVIMLMSSTAIERYEHFISTYPNLLQRVSQRMIASYLGITPEALSKVKGNKIRQK